MKVERIYASGKQTFLDIIDPFINLKIDEIVNNSKKVNTATSQTYTEGLESL